MLKPDETPAAARVKVTPLDVRQRAFKTAMRGFDREEVSAFLFEVAEDFHAALLDNDRLRQDLARAEAALQQYRELEGSLKTTLMSAQKVADDMRETASLEGARIVRDAESKAEMLMLKAQLRVEDVQREVDALTFKRREAETSLEATISTLRNALEVVRAQDQREEKAGTHRPGVDTATRPA